MSAHRLLERNITAIYQGEKVCVRQWCNDWAMIESNTSCVNPVHVRTVSIRTLAFLKEDLEAMRDFGNAGDMFERHDIVEKQRRHNTVGNYVWRLKRKPLPPPDKKSIEVII